MKVSARVASTRRQTGRTTTPHSRPEVPLTVWLDKDMQWYATVSGKRGRQSAPSRCGNPVLPEHQMLVRTGPASKLGAGRKSVALGGLDWRVPDFSTVCRRQKDLSVKLPYRPSKRHWICWSTAPASSSWVKANGSVKKSTVPNTGASGAKYTWPLMPARWLSVPSGH